MQKKNLYFRVSNNLQQMALHVVSIEIMDQPSVKPQINIVIHIDENMNT